MQVGNLIEDLKDGVILCNLLEVLTGEFDHVIIITKLGQPVKFTLGPKTPQQKMENLNSSFAALGTLGVVTKGCTPQDILSGKDAAVIGFLLIIIKRFKNVNERASGRFSVILTSMGSVTPQALGESIREGENTSFTIYLFI